MTLPMLTPEQTGVLLRDLAPSRVMKQDGMSHVAAWDIRAHLNRVFGFAGWSCDTLQMEQMYAAETTTKAGKPAWKVAYRAQVRLTIHATSATYTEWAVGESIMPDFKQGDCHDMAIKTAESQAMKRCAVNLGTQFGLSLYDNGRTQDVVRRVVGHDEIADEPVVVAEAGLTATELENLLALVAAASGDREALRSVWAAAERHLDEPVGGTTIREAVVAALAGEGE